MPDYKCKDQLGGTMIDRRKNGYLHLKLSLEGTAELKGDFHFHYYPTEPKQDQKLDEKPP